jgi:proteasome lid subunit RPN8/RPN11
MQNSFAAFSSAVMHTPTGSIIERIIADARASRSEICGALLGTDHVSAVVPLENESPNARETFFISATQVLRVEREAEASGRMVMGFYHSHPNSDAVPSATDILHAVPGYQYWIASRSDVRAWRLRDDRSGFDEVDIASRDDR